MVRCVAARSRRWLPIADKAPPERGPSHLQCDWARGRLVVSAKVPAATRGGALDVLPPPAERLAGPEPPTAEEIAAYVVGAAVWAPSVHNTQPWSVNASGQEISLLADAGRQLMVADPSGREMMISCGAALFTARLALRSLGYIPQTYVLP